jgi:hypothetical protein
MSDKKAVITDEEPLKRGQSVPLTDTGKADKEIPEIPPDERGGQIQPRDQDVHGVPEGPGHQDDDVIDNDDLEEDLDDDNGDDGLEAIS